MGKRRSHQSEKEGRHARLKQRQAANVRLPSACDRRRNGLGRIMRTGNGNRVGFLLGIMLDHSLVPARTPREIHTKIPRCSKLAQ